MTSGGFWAYGSKFQVGDGATPEVFTTVAEIIDVGGPKLERDSIEMTNQDSTLGWREFIPGLRDGGEVTFNCNWLPTNATQDSSTGVLSDFNDNVNHNCKIILPDTTTTLSFAAHVTGITPDLPLEDRGTLDITVKVSGPVVCNV